jgi:hypothetical protein
MTNISNRISNEKFFPTKHNSSFPSNFHQSIVKPIHKQMFRVFAHVYWGHFEVSLLRYQGAHIADNRAPPAGGSLELFLRSFHLIC